MVHKKYIKRGGKVFGPYLYENYREKGAVKTRYLGHAKKEKHADRKLLISFAGAILLIFLIGMGVFFFADNFYQIGKGLREGFESAKPVNVFVQLISSLPQIYGVPKDIYVCENKVLNYTFYIEYVNGIDKVNASISPRPFFIVFLENLTYTRGDYLIGSPNLTKIWVNLRRAGANNWAVYSEAIYAYDHDDIMKISNVKTNITIIEVNNPPVFNIPVQTIWNRGENSIFYYNVSEELERNYEETPSNELNFTIIFQDSLPIFNIGKGGILYLNASGNESLISPGNISKVYNIEACANDSGIKFPHPNISLCYPGGNELPKGYCDYFSLTITKENRAPNITSYNPINLNINAGGTDSLYFNVTSYDPDGNVPDTYWYVDDNLERYAENSSFDKFEYNFGCGVSGLHNVTVVVTDGLLNDSVQWNISLLGASCGSPPSSSGGGGGGGAIIKKPFCIEKWGCAEWGDCINLNDSLSWGKIGLNISGTIKGNCLVFGLNESNCGLQSRECYDINNCKKNSTNSSRPSLFHQCYYTANPSCYDGIQNCHNQSCEILPDCGGPCLECPTCSDGIQNQNEASIDCGGPCKPCEEKPAPPPWTKSLMFYSLLALLILIILLVIRQIIKYFEYKKRIKEERKKRFESGPYIARIVFLFVAIILIIFGIFTANLTRQGKIIIERNPEGEFLSSQGLMSGLFESFARAMLLDVIDVVAIHSDNADIAVWDDTDDSDKGNRYTYCIDSYCAQKDKPSSMLWDVYFYANFTNKSGGPIGPSNGNGICEIIFNEGGWGSWQTMSFDGTSLLWKYDKNFSNKGDADFNISCASDYENLSVLTETKITNTRPYIMKSAEGYIDFDQDYQKEILQCAEDTPCYYDFRSNISEDDLNDVLHFYYIDSNTTLTNFTLDPLTGLLLVNITNSYFAGNGKKVELTVLDSDNARDSAILEVNIAPVNDPPLFVNLSGQTFNSTMLFEYIVHVTDEENNVPFAFNASFISCSPASWSTRAISGDCNLFDSTKYAFDGNSGVLNISFTPAKNDVGTYFINFSVMDNSILGNQTTSQIVNFTVLLINDPPYFTYACDNERAATEDNNFSCWVNATDVFEEHSLLFSSNYFWFTFMNNSGIFNPASFYCNISTEYNVSARVNFTPGDAQVGNWSINITVTDTGSPIKGNSSIFWFYVANINDRTDVIDIPDFQGFSGNANYTLKINVSDDDLLITSSQKEYYNESFTIYTRDLSGIDLPWIYPAFGSINGNIQEILLNFTTITARNPGIIGEHWVNLTAVDKGGYEDSEVFLINISGNSPPAWDSLMQDDFFINEDEIFYLNLSENVSDLDGDPLLFSFGEAFPSFYLSNDGIISFIPSDIDVGKHSVTITASDSRSPSPKAFNFSVYNKNDAPSFAGIEPANGNASVDLNFNIDTREDNDVKLILWADDDDFKIPLESKSFYDEKLTLNLTIEGPNTALFNFIQDPSFPISGENEAKFDTFFRPKKQDIGNYTITLFIEDMNKSNSTLRFNLTIASINHPPALMNLSNYNALINQNFYLDINTADVEDINDSYGNLTYSYSFIEGIDFINSDPLIFNVSGGQLNVSFGAGDSGRYHINISVIDSGGMMDSADFWIFVYGYPQINYPVNCIYNMSENYSSNIIIRANSSAGENLTYELNLNGFRGNLSYYGNNTPLLWSFTPNFTDETYGMLSTLALAVYPAGFPEFNATRQCSVNISHTNSPVGFHGWIGHKSTTYANIINIDLKDYFSDIDAFDPYYNQTIEFSVQSNASFSYIKWEVKEWILSLQAMINKPFSETLNISAEDLNGSGSGLSEAFSNNFIIEFTEPATTQGGGGGGGSSTTLVPVSLKIIVPDKVSVYQNEKIYIPIALLNPGKREFSKIRLYASALKGNGTESNITLSLDKSYIETLSAGERENLILTVFFSGERKAGDYEILINASSEYPKYTDWAKIQINLQRINESRVKDKIVFTEEFIAQNPRCLELKEIIDEAHKYFESGDYAKAESRTEQAIDACKKSVSQVSLPRPPLRENKIWLYLALFIFIAFFIGIIYYWIKRRRLKNVAEPQDSNPENFNPTAG